MSLLTSWKSGLQAFGKSTNIVAAAASSALSMIPSRDATTSTKWNKVSKVMQKKHAKKNLTRGRNGGLSATSLYPEFSLAEFTKWPRPPTIVSQTIAYDKPAPQLLVAASIPSFQRNPY